MCFCCASWTILVSGASVLAGAAGRYSAAVLALSLPVPATEPTLAQAPSPTEPAEPVALIDTLLSSVFSSSSTSARHRRRPRPISTTTATAATTSLTAVEFRNTPISTPAIVPSKHNRPPSPQSNRPQRPGPFHRLIRLALPRRSLDHTHEKELSHIGNLHRLCHRQGSGISQFEGFVADKAPVFDSLHHDFVLRTAPALDNGPPSSISRRLSTVDVTTKQKITRAITKLQGPFPTSATTFRARLLLLDGQPHGDSFITVNSW